jgi:hypothetical protein
LRIQVQFGGVHASSRTRCLTFNLNDRFPRYVFAHEIGHLLLDQQVHSVQGIMRSESGFEDFPRITEGTLLFTPQEAEFLRAALRRRYEGQEFASVAVVEVPASPR